MKISEIDNEIGYILTCSLVTDLRKGTLISLEEFFKSGNNTRGNLRVFKRIIYNLNEPNVNIDNTIGVG